jgi:hypothetical protein
VGKRAPKDLFGRPCNDESSIEIVKQISNFSSQGAEKGKIL